MDAFLLFFFAFRVPPDCHHEHREVIIVFQKTFDLRMKLFVLENVLCSSIDYLPF